LPRGSLLRSLCAVPRVFTAKKPDHHLKHIDPLDSPSRSRAQWRR
jgi:hypothetical protein